jgi:hypothetical protein
VRLTLLNSAVEVDHSWLGAQRPGLLDAAWTPCKANTQDDPAESLECQIALVNVVAFTLYLQA